MTLGVPAVLCPRVTDAVCRKSDRTHAFGPAHMSHRGIASRTSATPDSRCRSTDCHTLLDMSRLYLRLLLALCLILNGLGNAIAAAAMPVMGAGSANATMSIHTAEPQSASPCDHGAGDKVMPAAPLASAASPAIHPADCGQDCCTQGVCSCACMHLAQAVLLGIPMLPVSPGLARMAAAWSPGHATPVLLQLIRPPIR